MAPARQTTRPGIAPDRFLNLAPETETWVGLVCRRMQKIGRGQSGLAAEDVINAHMVGNELCAVAVGVPEHNQT